MLRKFRVARLSAVVLAACLGAACAESGDRIDMSHASVSSRSSDGSTASKGGALGATTSTTYGSVLGAVTKTATSQSTKTGVTTLSVRERSNELSRLLGDLPHFQGLDIDPPTLKQIKLRTHGLVAGQVVGVKVLDPIFDHVVDSWCGVSASHPNDAKCPITLYRIDFELVVRVESVRNWKLGPPPTGETPLVFTAGVYSQAEAKDYLLQQVKDISTLLAAPLPIDVFVRSSPDGTRFYPAFGGLAGREADGSLVPVHEVSGMACDCGIGESKNDKDLDSGG